MIGWRLCFLMMLMQLTNALAFNHLALVRIIDNQRCIETASKHSSSGKKIQAIPSKICIALSPQKDNTEEAVTDIMGITLNGILIKPTSKKKWDKHNPNGYSKIGNDQWTVNTLQHKGKFGFDSYNGHKDIRGQYHYHSVDRVLVESTRGSLVGYAVDGFEIHYGGKAVRPSYILHKGKRPTDAPPGNYDGQYDEDYFYDRTKGNLDQCNGTMLSGRYVYFMTDRFPYFSRCLWGKIPKEFQINSEKANLPLKLVGKKK